jgi:hypothetical protein
MRTKEPSLLEIHRRGLRALAKALGPSGYMRFMQLYQVGRGDYTKERHRFLKQFTMDDIAAAIRAQRKRR